ncbi:hypothetical protein ACFQYP_46555 [Nonomuraea antimicrobica]
MTEPTGGSTDRPRRPVVVPAIALVAATALGITALLGGLSEATEEPDPLGQGAVLDQGLYSTKFVESRVKVEPPRMIGTRRSGSWSWSSTSPTRRTTPSAWAPRPYGRSRPTWPPPSPAR